MIPLLIPHFHFRRRFDYDKNRLPNRHLASLEESVTCWEESRPYTGLSIGYPAWNVLYYLTFASLRLDVFNVVVETGTNWGCSTIVLAQALEDSKYNGKVYSVEISAENLDRAAANIEKAGLLDRVELILQDSLEFLHKPPYGDQIISVAYLDDRHHADHVVAEFGALQPNLDDRSIVVFDNTAKNPYTPGEARVNEALREIVRIYGGNLINLENTSADPHGQAIWQRHGFRQDWT